MKRIQNIRRGTRGAGVDLDNLTERDVVVTVGGTGIPATYTYDPWQYTLTPVKGLKTGGTRVRVHRS